MRYLFPMLIALVFLCIALIVAFCVSDVRRINNEKKASSKKYYRVANRSSVLMLGKRHGEQDTSGVRNEFR